MNFSIFKISLTIIKICTYHFNIHKLNFTKYIYMYVFRIYLQACIHQFICIMNYEFFSVLSANYAENIYIITLSLQTTLCIVSDLLCTILLLIVFHNKHVSRCINHSVYHIMLISHRKMCVFSNRFGKFMTNNIVHGLNKM